MIPIVITPPALEPVTVNDQKAHSRIDTDADDGLLSGLLRAARDRCEGILARKLITQTVRWHPSEMTGNVKLPYPNVQSVTVQYYDADGDLQTVSGSAVYRVLNANDPANDCTLELLTGQVWPTADLRLQPWVIEMVVGYGATAENVPDEIKLGIRLLVAQWYENREVTTGGIVADLPFTVSALWATHQWSPVT